MHGDYFLIRVQDSGTYEVIKLPDHISWKLQKIDINQKYTKIRNVLNWFCLPKSYIFRFWCLETTEFQNDTSASRMPTRIIM